MAKSSESGGLADSCACTTRRAKVWRKLFVVMRPKAIRASGAGEFGGFVPPIQHEVGGFRHVGISGAERLGVTVAQIFAHSRRADEWRIADDEIRLWPSAPGAGSCR